MNIKPTAQEAKDRLRLDDALSDDLDFAIEQAYAECLAILQRDDLHPDKASLDAAIALDAAHTGMVVRADIIAAQLLLIDSLIGSGSTEEQKAKREAAIMMLNRHALMKSASAT